MRDLIFIWINAERVYSLDGLRMEVGGSYWYLCCLFLNSLRTLAQGIFEHFIPVCNFYPWTFAIF